MNTKFFIKIAQGITEFIKNSKQTHLNNLAKIQKGGSVFETIRNIRAFNKKNSVLKETDLNVFELLLTRNAGKKVVTNKVTQNGLIAPKSLVQKDFQATTHIKDDIKNVDVGIFGRTQLNISEGMKQVATNKKVQNPPKQNFLTRLLNKIETLKKNNELQQKLNVYKDALTAYEGASKDYKNIKDIEKLIVAEKMKYSKLLHPMVKRVANATVWSSIGCAVNANEIIDAKEKVGTGAMLEEIAKTSFLWSCTRIILQPATALIKANSTAFGLYNTKMAYGANILTVAGVFGILKGSKSVINNLWATEYEKAYPKTIENAQNN